MLYDNWKIITHPISVCCMTWKLEDNNTPQYILYDMETGKGLRGLCDILSTDETLENSDLERSTPKKLIISMYYFQSFISVRRFQICI